MEEYTKERVCLLLRAQELTALATPLAIETELSANLGLVCLVWLATRPFQSICPDALP
jgi:hypothetical protein